jgi:hypothetical protein
MPCVQNLLDLPEDPATTPDFTAGGDSAAVGGRKVAVLQASKCIKMKQWFTPNIVDFLLASPILSLQI